MNDGCAQRRRFLRAAGGVVATLAIPIAGAAPADPPAPPAPAPAPTPTPAPAPALAPGALGEATLRTVTIDGFAFHPAVLTVDRGDTVVWRNDDPVPHTVTAPGGFDSGSIAAGGTWRYTPAASGRYEYICAFHPMMKGSLVVR